MNFKIKILITLAFLYNINLLGQNVMVEQTFTYLNSGSKTFTVADLKVINLPIGSLAIWYDSFTGGTTIPVTSPLISGKKYFLETIPAAAIGSRLQTIVYEISPNLTANPPNNVCNGELVKISANNILSSEQFTSENTNGKGLNLTKVTEFGNSTYYVRPQSMPWENANNLINSIPGASMYIINSTAEESAVYNALRSLGLANPTNDGNALWLGLKQYSTATNFSDTSAQTGWYWIDGSPLTYSNWSAGEPNDYASNPAPPGFLLYDAGSIKDEDYAQFDFSTQGIKWNDAPNNSSDRNSYAILEFNATNNLQWYKYNYTTNTYDILPGETKAELSITAVTGNQKYRFDMITNGEALSLEYEVIATSPNFFPIPTNLTTTCDDEADPLLQDGKANFDTSTFQSTLLGGQTGMTVKYFDQNGNPLPSPLPNPFLTATQNVSVRIENSSNPSCFVSGIIPFFVNPMPKIRLNTSGNEDVFICSNASPASATLDAGIADGTPTSNYTYVWSKEGVVISGETNPTLTVNTSGKYAVEVTSKATGCKSNPRTIQFTISAAPQFFSIAPNLTTTCDDEADPLLQDGKANFDTSTFQSTLLGGQTGMTVKYFDQNGVNLPSPLPNPFLTATQNVLVRIENSSNPSCFVSGIIPFFVNPSPKIKLNTFGNEDVFICSNASPASATLDAGIADGTPTSNYTFIWSKEGVVISGETNPTLTVNTSGKYAVEVTSKATGCKSTPRTIQFTISATPQIFSIAPNLTTTCDDEAAPLLQDGKANFDTSTFQSTLLGGQTGMTVKYFDQNGVNLPSPLPNPFLTATQNVSVRIENSSNPSCFITGTIPFVVNPSPKINDNFDGSDDILICFNQSTINETLDASLQDGTPTSNYTYVWAKEGSIIIGETNYTLTANSQGNYSVEVTSIATGCKSIRSINITPSEPPKIASIDKLELSNSNSIQINPVKSGSLLFSIYGENGSFQSSNFFNNLDPGVYEAVVKDINGCGIDKQTVYIIGAPKYFTPNSDGFNDTWNIKGINAIVNANSVLFIFDRYGKLITQISPLGEGWNGTYNGYLLPADDYWYALQLEDGREVKGHFSLKR